MKTEKQLAQLMNIRTALKTSVSKMKAYIDYSQKNKYSLDVKTKTQLFQEWYSPLSNTIGAILASRDCFTVSKEKWLSFESKVKEAVPIPKRLENSFSSNDDISYARVLRIARNLPQHPEKTNQLKYVYLADAIPIESLLGIQQAAIDLFDSELEILSQDERNTMVRGSVELTRSIYAMQDALLPYLDQLQTMEGVTPKQIETLKNFIQYTPTTENIVFYDPTEEK